MSDWKTAVEEWKVEGAFDAPPPGLAQDPDGNGVIADASDWEIPNGNGGSGPAAAGGDRACFNCGQEG